MSRLDMGGIKLAEIRAAIAACNFVEDGSTQEIRQETNAKRVKLYRQLDECRSTLDKLMDKAATTAENTGEIEVRICHSRRRIFIHTVFNYYYNELKWRLFPHFCVVKYVASLGS